MRLILSFSSSYSFSGTTGVGEGGETGAPGHLGLAVVMWVDVLAEWKR